jgi:hypothetical protein
MKREINAQISVIEPVGNAIEKVKAILFQPFSFQKWCVIGLGAWLAYLMGSGGGNNGRVNYGMDKHDNVLEHAIEYIAGNLIWIVPVACVAVVALILIWLVLTWLSSRGQFMFLHCVATNKGEAKVPWAKFRSHGNSLFLFRVILVLVTAFVITFYIIVAALGIFALSGGESFGVAAIVATVFAVLGLIVLCVAVFVVSKFTTDFVVPIMFLRTPSCMAGWREFRQILSARKGSFLLYLLFQIVIAIAMGALVLTVVLMTCCTAACLLIIPYVGTVLLLPVLVFKRAYSLCYLRQFGPEFDVFATESEASQDIAGEPV